MNVPPTTANARRTPLFALLAANAISMVGNNLQAVAIPWFVLESTGSATRTGVIAFASILPTVLAALLGGAVVDRVGHWRISVVADIVSAVTVGMIPLMLETIGLAYWQLVVLVFLSAVLDAPGNTARMAMVPDLAERGAFPLERANSANQAIQSFSILAGPILAGVAIASLGASNALWLNAISFLLSAGLVVLLVPATAQQFVGATRYLEDVRAGLSFILGDGFLLATIAVGGLANFAGAPLLAVVMPVFARETYGEATDLGLLLGAIGAGSLIGALAFGFAGGQVRRWPLLVGLSALSALPMFVLATQPPLLAAIGLLLIAGFADGAMNPLMITAVQQRVEPAMLGRVMGTMLACILAAAPLGMLATGLAIERWGIAVTVSLTGVVLAIVFAIVAVLPAIREVDAARLARAPAD